MKKWNSDAELRGADRPNYDQKIPHLGFGFKEKKMGHVTDGLVFGTENNTTIWRPFEVEAGGHR